MIIYLADRHMNIVATCSNNLPKGLKFQNDLKAEDVESGVATFSVDILYDEEDAVKTAQYCESGNYVIVYDDNEENGFYTIIEAENDRKEHRINIYAEDGGLDLLNEVVDAYTADAPHPIAFYVEKFSYDSGFEIGLNEVSDLNRTLSWTGQDTCTARILSVANSFDAEIGFSFTVKNMTITHKYINIYKKRGNENVAQLRLNTDIDNIIVKSSISDLTTCLIPSGGTPEGSEYPITLAGYSYDDGDIYVNELGWIASRTALAKWSRYQWETYGSYGGHIVKYYSYDTTSQSELCNRSISYLKKYYDIIYNYEVDIAILPDNVRIGDTINIIDENGELYLNARVLKLETSSCDKTATATLGDFLIREGGISEKVQMMAEQFKDYVVKQREQTYKTQQLAKSALTKANEASTTATTASKKADDAKANATDAINKSTEAINKSAEAITESKQANQSAGEAKTSAETALTKIDSATADLKKAQDNINSLRSDISSTNKSLDELAKEAGETKETLDGLNGDLQETKETLELSYAKKTDLSSTEASLKAEITKSATELSSSIERTYAGKSELTDIQGKLESQITQNAEGLTSQSSKIDKLENDTADAQLKITAASEAALKAQGIANEAQTAADNAKTAADEAQTAADEAASKASSAQQKANEAKTTAEAANTRLVSAESDLSAAKENLKNVTADVNATKEQVQAAQNAVTKAEKNVAQAMKDATDAQNVAKTAQSAADTAKTTANTAQDTANKAKANADEATKTANLAKETADKAQETVAGLTKRVTSAETKISQNSEAISTSASKITEIGNKLTNNYYSKTETDALLKVESDRVTTTVSRVETVEKKSLTSTVEEFYQSTSPTTLTGGTWSTTQPAWTQGKYIWRRFLITKGDGSTSYSPSATGVCISGNTGATGKGVKSSIVTYQGSTSGTTVPTGTWSTSIPTVAQGQYLWTKTVITYTDNTTSTSYSVSYISKNGNDGAKGDKGDKGETGATGAKGDKGDKGDKGRGIASTIVTYQAWKDGTTTPTGTWSTTPPTTTASNPYLWTKTVITYTDGTSSTGYSVGSTPEGITVGGRNLIPSSTITPYNLYIKNKNSTKQISMMQIPTGNGGYLVFNIVLNAGTYTLNYELEKQNEFRVITSANATDIIDTIKGNWTNNSEYQEHIGGNGNWKNVPMPYTFTLKSSAKVGIVFLNTSGSAINDTVSNLKLEKGNKATDWTPAPEDVANDISAVDTKVTAVETKATQLADKFNWLVKSGTSATDFTLTDRTATLISQYINLNGLVTFSGLSSDAQSKITSAGNTANSALSKAGTAQSTANSANSLASTANSTANSALDKATSVSNSLSNYTLKTLPDTRNDNQPPSWYFKNYPRQVVTEFKYSNVIGITGSEYCTLRTEVPWPDAAGGYPKQIASVDGKQLWRVGTSQSEWSEWIDVGSWCSANDKTMINGGKIYTGSVTAEKISVNTLSSLSANLGSITAGSININNKFIVDSAGNLKATSAELTGKITATSGTIAGINIESGRLYTSKESIVHHQTGDPVSSTDANRCYVLNTTEIYDTGYLKVTSDYTIHSQSAEDNNDLSGNIGTSIIRGGFLTIKHDVKGGGYTSIKGHTIIASSNNFGTTTISGGDITASNYYGSFCGYLYASNGWAGKEYFSSSEWVGWYNAKEGARKGWIGHNGDMDFHICNEAGGRITLNGGDVYADGFIDSQWLKTHCTDNSEGQFWDSYDYGNARLRLNIYNHYRGEYGCEYHFIKHTDGTNSFRPGSDGAAKLGTSNCRWSTVYSTSGSVSTSDMKQKDVINDYDFKAKDFIMGLKPIAYQLNAKGANGKRIHMGFGAQPVYKLINNLELGDLSLVEAWKIREDSDIEEPYYGEKMDDKYLRWGMKYEELLAPLVALVQEQQIKIEKLEKIIGGN